MPNYKAALHNLVGEARHAVYEMVAAGLSGPAGILAAEVRSAGHTLERGLETEDFVSGNTRVRLIGKARPHPRHVVPAKTAKVAVMKGRLARMSGVARSENPHEYDALKTSWFLGWDRQDEKMKADE
jgi:hypothetical protein